MKFAIAFLSALAVTCFAPDSTSALQSVGVGRNETDGNEIARALTVSASAVGLYNCPSPSDEEFALMVTHARVETHSGGGYKIFYRTNNDRIRYRCFCKYIDDKSFERFFGPKFVSESRPNVWGYSRNPKADFQTLQHDHDVITGDMLFDFVAEFTAVTVEVC